MQINISNAIKYFFSNPSLEMVYFEAVANAIDANAHNIEIQIDVDSFSNIDSLSIAVKDDGDGFNDKNFERFKKLLDVNDISHKGIGRLVYLNYFDRVNVISQYGGEIRKFEFSSSFDGENGIKKAATHKQETLLVFRDYKKEKIRAYDYLKPESIKRSLLQHFFPLFYQMKVDRHDLRILITLNVKESNVEHGFYSDKKVLNIRDIPDMEIYTLDEECSDLFEDLKLFYSITETEEDVKPITALCVDGRAIQLDIQSKGGMPVGYEIIFILFSSRFDGQSNASRQEINIAETELRSLKRLFGEVVAKVLNEKVPKIRHHNISILNGLNERFPHLVGYFDRDVVGFIDRDTTLENAQLKFLNAQKEILDASTLSDEQFLRSLEISSRILTEYILYRHIIIERMKNIDFSVHEADIHNIIVPMRKKFSKDNFSKDIFNNNAWLLDDKYMSYTTILSDKDMDNLIKEISIEGESIDDETRPDIAIVFSNDPRTADTKYDVVIVELKKKGLKLADKETVISQLRQRARKLLKYYNKKIQRIWFYGIVDFDMEFIRSLKEDNYLEIYSNDKYYYKEIDIIPEYDDNLRVPVGVNILSYDAFVRDAEARNSTFLRLLKDGLKREYPDD